eukprot:XP_011446899.1 PREDICTED: leucine-rich repeats and immunoglobulin-like domains protein 1 isoform X3 [Crassostrea gigas]
MITLCFGLFLIKGFVCLTITTPPEINATLESNSSIILNCTFEKKDNEQIRNVYWKKKISGDYKLLVDVTPNYVDYSAQGGSLKNRSELFRFGNGSTSVVLIIKDVRCLDNGQYQCSINYKTGETTQIAENNTAVNIQGPFKANAVKPKVFSVQPNISLEEHGMVKLSCVGDVGNPQGSLKIWKIYKTTNTKHLIKNESEDYADVEKCTHIVNLTTTYNLTKEDNGAVFRCSSQNQYTTEPVPATDIGPLEVFYGPSTTRIIPVDNLSGLHVGNLVKFECISDGNPNPNYTWIFNFTEVVSDGKYIFSANKSELSFITTNITDSGYYQCVATNYFNGKTFNSSSNVTSLSVQEKRGEDIVNTFVQNCQENPCSLIQSCISRNGSAYCSLNIWSVIAFVFITLTLIFGTTCISLTLSRRRLKKNTFKDGSNIGDVHVSYTRGQFEDFGGYADPKDVKRPENEQIKSDKDGRDNPYADPVDFQTQYAVVQKNWETPAKSSKDANSSDTSNLLNNTDLSNTANQLNPPETTNPKNSSSDEKTSASTETSETIPNPPNVYDGAWV